MSEDIIEYFKRNPTVTEREMGGKVFLAEPEIDNIVQLDTIATAVWRLLAQPISIEEIVTTVHTAFPNTPLDEIEDDITILIEDLEDDELIICCDG